MAGAVGLEPNVEAARSNAKLSGHGDTATWCEGANNDTNDNESREAKGGGEDIDKDAVKCGASPLRQNALSAAVSSCSSIAAADAAVACAEASGWDAHHAAPARHQLQANKA